MVHAGSPLSHIIHSRHSCLVVDGSLGDGFPFSARCHAEPDKASGMEGRIAAMVPKPVLGKFRPGLGTHACHIRCGRCAAVVEGFEPFFVACHPSGILIVPLVIAEQAGIGLPAVGFGRGHTHVGDELVLAGVSVGQQPYEMCGEIVFGFHAVAVAVGVLFMTEHVGNARGGAARSGTLVEDGWKIACGGIVHMVGTSRSGGTPASCRRSSLITRHKTGGYGVRIEVSAAIVGEFRAVDGDVPLRQRLGKASGDGPRQQHEGKEMTFHIVF